MLATATPARAGVALAAPRSAESSRSGIAVATAEPAGPTMPLPSRQGRVPAAVDGKGSDAGQSRADHAVVALGSGAGPITPGPIAVTEGQHLAIKVGLTTAVDDTTAVNFSVTNNRSHALGLLIIRCNALTAAGAASGQAFDALHDIDVGETVYGQALFLKQTIAPRSSFACRDEGTAD